MIIYFLSRGEKRIILAVFCMVRRDLPKNRLIYWLNNYKTIAIEASQAFRLWASER